MAPTRKLASILPVMVGTAGHVDHGKSALVKLLTGCDMDRHPEARARGLTIDLGFAPCRLPGNRLVGIVDVPGHEDFIRNMVAGAASIDVLLLIVAADDGIMPQTREHLLIVRTLRTPRVLVVVTKIDLVDADLRQLVQEEVSAFLAENGFPDAPVLLASNVTFEGIEAVRKKLIEIVDAVEPPSDPRAFRMNVERVFSVKGYGTVVTGVPTSGTVSVDSELELLPAGTRHRVRAVQTYKQDATAAPAGACAAVNLRDLDTEAVARGMTLASPGLYRFTSGCISRVRNDHSALALKRVQSVKVHAGTASVNGSVKLIGAQSLKPGEQAFAHIRLASPLVMSAGDRFVLRLLNPATTLGGGTVLSAQDVRSKSSDPHLLPRLEEARRAAEAGDVWTSELLAGPDPVLAADTLRQLTRCPPSLAEERVRAAEADGTLTRLGSQTWLVTARRGELEDRAEKLVARYHAHHPYAWGMDATAAARAFDVRADAFQALARVLTDGDALRLRHGRLALATFEPQLTARQMRWREAILERVKAGRIDAPARGDLMEALGIPEKEMRLLQRLLIEEGAVIFLEPNLVAADVLCDCRQQLEALLASQPVVGIKDFRQATGASRNLAVALLERFDSEGLTRRVEGGRVRADKG